MKRQYSKGESGLIAVCGVSGIYAYLTGVIQGYIQGFMGEHRAVRQSGRLAMPVTALVLVCCVVPLAVSGFSFLKNETGAASVAQAAEEKTEISLSLENKEKWCQRNTICVSTDESQPVEYRYICTTSGEDSGWGTERRKNVDTNGTWMIQVRDASGTITEQEIEVANIDNQPPVIRSITEKTEGEAVENEE